MDINIFDHRKGGDTELLTEISSTLKRIERIFMATKDDLDAAIAALPAAMETAIEAAVQPIIDAIKAKGGADLQPEIDQLNALGDTVSKQVATDLGNANP